MVALAALAWFVNRVQKGRWGHARQKLMIAEFKRVGSALAAALALAAVNEAALRGNLSAWLLTPIALITLILWVLLGLRIARVWVFEWLFANNAREGVPVLLVDLATLGASLVAFAWLLHTVFLIEVTSLIATSAVASVVLGLALQDTLGHLFAGISLQFDRPFRLGDWIEVRTGTERIAGQVLEVSWRATSLLAAGEELIIIPNKAVATGLVLNYSGRERPFIRSHIFRVPLNAPLALVKDTLKEAAQATPGVLEDPAPIALVIETTESWVSVKALNFIDDYGKQFGIGDAFQSYALELLQERGIKLASARLEVETAAQVPSK